MTDNNKPKEPKPDHPEHPETPEPKGPPIEIEGGGNGPPPCPDCDED